MSVMLILNNLSWIIDSRVENRAPTSVQAHAQLRVPRFRVQRDQQRGFATTFVCAWARVAATTTICLFFSTVQLETCWQTWPRGSKY